MNINIYLPEELGQRVQAAEGLNVSAVCQDALRRQLDSLEYLDEDDLEEVSVTTGDVAASFYGRPLAMDNRTDASAWLSAADNIVVVAGDGTYEVYPDFDAFTGEGKIGWAEARWVATVAEALGERPPVLDI